MGKVRLPPFPAESPVADPECFPSSGCLWLAANVSPGAFKNLSQDTQGAAGRVVWQHVKIANVIAQSVCCCGGICRAAHLGAGPEGPGMVAGGKGHPMKRWMEMETCPAEGHSGAADGDGQQWFKWAAGQAGPPTDQMI